MSNYRPISLIPVIAKVFEAVLKIQLVSYFEVNNLFFENQHGFRKHKSTFTAMLKGVTDILDAFEERNSVALVLADLSKAFDCVSHPILLEKLKAYGVTGQAHNLMISYLQDRKQIMSIRGAMSSPLAVKHGVPQGSILGPMLFLIMINDIGLLGNILLFADDTTIFSKGRTLNEAKDAASRILLKAQDWFQTNKLSLNNGKTQEMICSLKPSNQPSDVTVKLLGFTIDPKLSWNNHIDNVCARLARVTFLLRRLKMQLMEQHLITIYYGLFNSHLSYGLLLWGHSPNCLAVLKLQKKTLRIITSADSLEHCKPIFRRLKILTIFGLYIFQSLTYVKENSDYITTRADMHNYQLRTIQNFSVPFCRLSKKKDCFPVLAYKMFNMLPEDVRHLELTPFKTRLKNWLTREAFYSIKEFYDCDFSSI